MTASQIIVHVHSSLLSCNTYTLTPVHHLLSAHAIPHLPGSGLNCHRIITLICHLAGIKDIYAKIIGSTNPLNIVRATMQGLTSQASWCVGLVTIVPFLRDLSTGSHLS